MVIVVCVDALRHTCLSEWLRDCISHAASWLWRVCRFGGFSLATLPAYLVGFPLSPPPAAAAVGHNLRKVGCKVGFCCLLVVSSAAISRPPPPTHPHDASENYPPPRICFRHIGMQRTGRILANPHTDGIRACINTTKANQNWRPLRRCGASR